MIRKNYKIYGSDLLTKAENNKIDKTTARLIGLKDSQIELVIDVRLYWSWL